MSNEHTGEALLIYAEEARAVVEGQNTYLRGESYEIRHALERITDPLLGWVWEVYGWLRSRSGSEVSERFVAQLESIDGLSIDIHDESISIDYNVEREMDARTANAMGVLHEALSTFVERVEDDPLVGADADPRTAPVVNVLRTVAEALGR